MLKRSLWLIPVLLLWVIPSRAAIAHDADSNAGSSVGNVSSFSWAHTCTGSNLILAVRISVRSNAGTGTVHPTAVTYNSVGLTEQQHYSPIGGGYPSSYNYVGIWYLKAPATGSNTIAVTLSGSPGGTDVYASATSFTGVDQTTPIDNAGATSSGIGPVSTASYSLTTSNANAWIVDGIAYTDLTQQNVTALGSQVKDYQGAITQTVDLASSYNGPIASPGSNTDGYTTSDSNNYAILVGFSIKPAAAGGVVRHRAMVINR